MPIEVKSLSYTYSKKTPYEKKALNDISFTINDGDIVGVVGSTGSGKSTLIQHINALIRVQEGSVIVDDIDLSVKKPKLLEVRKKVGMLFQYPEYQLFADTVLKDVMFGPLNFGIPKEEAEQNSIEALKKVGLNPESIINKSPIELSGGQKRRVAIAGVISYMPKILVLDEPTAGLDPIGKREILDLTQQLIKNGDVKIVIMVSHNMDEIAEYTNRIIALNNSRLVADTSTENFFYNYDIESLNLTYPHVVNIVKKLNEKGFNLPTNILNKTQLKDELIKSLKGQSWEI